MTVSVAMVIASYFNPLPSCEGRHDKLVVDILSLTFQSTPLMRGETMISADGGFFLKFQSTPLMRGETMGGKGILAVFVISILSPLTRGDSARPRNAPGRWYFNPLPSYEGRLSAGVPLQCLQVFQSTPLMRGETA